MTRVRLTAQLIFVPLGAVATVAYFLLPARSIPQALVFLAWLLAAVTLVLLRVVRERWRPLWLTLAAGALVYGLTTTAWYLGPLLQGGPLPYPSPVDAGFFVAYGAYGLFLLSLILAAGRSRTGALGPALDAVVVGAAGALIVQRVLIEPVLGAGPALDFATVTTLAYSGSMIVLGGLVAQLALVRGVRTRVDLYALVWVGGELIATFLFAHLSLQGTFDYGHPVFAVWFVSYVGLGLLAVEPEASRPVSAPAWSVAPQARLALLGAAVAVPIALVLSPGFDASPFHSTYEGWLVGIVALVLLRVFVLLRDVETERSLRGRLEALSAELEFGATHDPLTSLLNRAALGDALFRARARHARGVPVSVIVLDLDGFKAVNDTFGHGAGDAVLQVVARRLRTIARDSDAVARLGGDEFAIVAEDLTVEDAISVGNRIVAALSSPVAAGAVRATLGVSVGIHALETGDTEATTLRNADAAMYAAKALGGGVQLFDPQSHGRYLERHELTLQLRAAPAAGELVLHYQPVVELEHRAIVAAEALVRWQHPTRGLLGPGQFIDLAEDTGAIVEVGRWVLDQACRDAADWQQRGGGWDGVGVAVNVSRRQLRSPSIIEDVATVLAASGLPPRLLTIEITETALMAETDEMVRVLGRIKLLGVQVAMDDFGTGYSSLAQLRRLPVDVLKIDRSFVSGIAHEDEEWALAAAIVRLATSLGRTTLAEGVERASQLAHLRTLGVRLAQGFLFSRPVPVTELLARSPRPTVADV